MLRSNLLHTNKNMKHVIVIYQDNLLIGLGPWCYHVRNNFIKNIWKERPLQCRKENAHCVKSVHIWSYSRPYFSAFGLNTVWYSVCLRIQSECGKIRTDITEYGHFLHSGRYSGNSLPQDTPRQFRLDKAFCYTIQVELTE